MPSFKRQRTSYNTSTNNNNTSDRDTIMKLQALLEQANRKIVNLQTTVDELVVTNNQQTAVITGLVNEKADNLKNKVIKAEKAMIESDVQKEEAEKKEKCLQQENKKMKTFIKKLQKDIVSFFEFKASATDRMLMKMKECNDLNSFNEKLITNSFFLEQKLTKEKKSYKELVLLKEELEEKVEKLEQDLKKTKWSIHDDLKLVDLLFTKLKNCKCHE
ncbi:hypothetical protein BDB01DRAFT_836105 [Pilobolus umbonatus]|nr:hypothetical protein BDB01DRAFT_836105 [Pilobolus umbonatus]